MAVTDYNIDTINGLIFRNGDLDKIESEQKHIQDILVSNKGSYKQFTLLGVGAQDFVAGSTPIDEIKKKIKVGLEFDNFNVESILQDSSGLIRIIARQNEKL